MGWICVEGRFGDDRFGLVMVTFWRFDRGIGIGLHLDGTMARFHGGEDSNWFL